MVKTFQATLSYELDTSIKRNITMALFHKQSNLLIMSTLMGLIALPSIVTPATAQKVNNSGNTDKNSSLNQPNSTPTYPAAPPPERIKPLPNERQLQQRETEVDDPNFCN